MDLGLRGKVAVVTGGANGIGAAVVNLLVEEGARVAVWDRTPGDQPVGGLSVQCSVTDAESLKQALQVTQRELGDIEIVVHAAAIGSGYFGFPYTRVPAEAWAEVLNVNIMGMVNIAYLLGPALQEQKRGSMVFLASIAGQIGSQTDPPYSASKAANINFAQCLAKDLAPYGVRVNTICPGMVKTRLNESVWKAWYDQQPTEKQKSYDEWATEKIRNVIPLQRWQTVEDIAAMIVFLCSGRCREVTGQTINVDGGCVMHW